MQEGVRHRVHSIRIGLHMQKGFDIEYTQSLCKNELDIEYMQLKRFSYARGG